ncbi:hypothetical protein CFII64_24079 [Pseudomonas sp. CFII64]|uniref:hypothetical protein n=1 Tax=Pseudomonas sp. CFII64 TaxID=911242 RepID=UPI000357FEC0|nr:hypothetical protein [Pseudomonas sp. CFII64]EPJ77222.1 hypothetical protein CFII64_24079 [Pseudomonas sp. CFII64]
MTKITPEEIFVVGLLNDSLGLELKSLPTIPLQETPDFSTIHGGKKFLLELKSSFESDLAIKAKKKAYDQDEIYIKEDLIQPSGKNSKNFHKASKQLNNRKSSEAADYCLYIINLIKTDGGYQEHTVLANLLGEANILTDEGPLSCLYYHESEFFKQKDLVDAAIIITKSHEIALVINDYSPRYESFRNSSFAGLFDLASIYDPIVMEESREVISIREGISRKDTTALKLHLQEKYKFTFAIQTDFHSMFASFQVDR